MLDITKHKPNLIPNNPKDGSFTIEERNKVIEKNGGISQYLILFKKDGCRLQLGLGPDVLGRSLKKPKSELLANRFKALNELCIKLKIAVDGEFYMHGLTLNENFRFFSNTDVTRDKVKIALEKEYNKNPEKFNKDYKGKSIEFLTTFHDELKFWLFDGIVLDRPDLVGYEERILEIINRLANHDLSEMFIEFPDFISLSNIDQYDPLYKEALLNGWEGLVATHREHKYKFGRNTIKEGTILKEKNDGLEYDGIILDVEEQTKVKEGTEKTRNELGRSRTSQKKEDREPSGIAKGFIVQFEDIGTFSVGLRGFDNELRKKVFENKEDYIGRHFVYTGMPPNKDFPLIAYFKEWRDEK